MSLNGTVLLLCNKNVMLRKLRSLLSRLSLLSGLLNTQQQHRKYRLVFSYMQRSPECRQRGTSKSSATLTLPFVRCVYTAS
jgi:Ribonuclease G/E